MYRCRLTLIALLTASLLPATALFAQQSDAKLGESYEAEIRPLLKQFCIECHSGDRLEAEIDLAGFNTIADVRRKTPLWQRVDEMLQTEQMPPIDSKQPSDGQGNQLRSWVRGFLIDQARTDAGDPGPVILRRLSNAEYTYTIGDLTVVPSLDPAKEFPIDGAAGEGFTNTGSGLVMSPSLIQKYLDAGKSIARHAALLPDGIRFTPFTSERDLTDEALKRIRNFYARYTTGGGGSKVNLQGIKFDTNQGGVIPIEDYLNATIAQREALRAGRTTIQQVASNQNLSPKYLGILWRELSANDDSIVIKPLREAWRQATVDDVPSLTKQIAAWQNQVWQFNVVGHLGREGAAKSWMQPQVPIAQRREFRLKLPPPAGGEDIVVYLTVADAGDGTDNDFALWRDMRLEAKGKTPIKLRDLRGIDELSEKWNAEILSRAEDYLVAAAGVTDHSDIERFANEYKLNSSILRTWMKYLNLSVGGPARVKSHFTEQLPSGGGYAFVSGWGRHETPSVIANSSDQQVRIPGISRPHGVVVHPSPTLFVAIGWQSPSDGVVQVEASVADAHPECGNGVEWLVQHRSGNQVSTLAGGDFPSGKSARMDSKTLSVHKGELVSLLVGPRQEDHSCDLTAVDFTITELSGKIRVWDLGQDVSANLLESNPHADRFGNKATWHFYTGPMADVNQETTAPVAIPPGSLLARWQHSRDPKSRSQLAKQVAALAGGNAPQGDAANSADGMLYRQLHQLNVPPDDPYLLSQAEPDPRFGVHALGHAIDSDQIVVKAPSTLAFRIPAALATGRQLVGVGMYGPTHGHECSTQLMVSTSPPSRDQLSKQPLICKDGSKSRERIGTDFKRFRELFPPAVCYTKIVPVDEVVTATLFHREDDLLKNLLLSEDECAVIDRLWNELIFVSEAPLQQVIALEQIRAFSTQDRQDLVGPWDKMKPAVLAGADQFRKQMADTEPIHVDAVVGFAAQAWRRPISDDERRELKSLYKQLRSSELSHRQSIRLMIARVLTSPTFLYRRELPPSGTEAQPVGHFELANRLSYFLWSSMPDEELRRTATSGQLHDETELLMQTRRMLRHEKIRRMAIHFACQWLHLRDFDVVVEKNESLYPEFADLRSDMYQETVLFFDDLFRNDRSILAMFDSDHSFVNQSLAKFYGVDGVDSRRWRRVEGMKQHGRGGLLGMATVLASQSGASRTSPILRGNWVNETLLGQRLPKPPANVPQLPDAVPEGLSARELIEHHSGLPECARCHQRIDPYGFSLEQFDAIGRLRPQAVDTESKLPDGRVIEGIEGLRNYLLEARRDDLIRQFCRKLLGYALGRGVRLSDESLLEAMQQQLQEEDFRFSAAVQTIVLSKQFRQIRGRDFVDVQAYQP